MVHRLRIELVNVKPLVWRRVEIISGAKLPFVSRVLLECMGWDDTHLHLFDVGGTRYGVPDPDYADRTLNERAVTLAKVASRPKDSFLFDYDFGDGWRHRVVVEAIVQADETIRARCVGGLRACPPEDCGGPDGYARLLEILADRTHDEHETMRRWVGGRFDPGAFDLAETNRRLRSLVRTRRSNSE